jgi:hypothetical protein
MTNQVISTADYPGPVYSDGGDITVDAGASIAGGPTGVYAENYGIGTLSNNGEIIGANFAGGVQGGIGVKVASGQTVNLLSNVNGATISGGNGPSSGTAAAGSGVSNAGTITSLTNAGKISSGETGGSYNLPGVANGIVNSGTIATLTNTGTILGGIPAGSSHAVAGGIFNLGTITALSNSGTIQGGGYSGRVGAGIANVGTISSLTNSGVFSAARTGLANFGTIKTLSNSGRITDVRNDIGAQIGSFINQASGVVDGNRTFSYGYSWAVTALYNGGIITALTNKGSIRGATGGQTAGGGGFGGALGLWNAGTIKTLTNSGTITGGNGGNGYGNGGDGIYSTGTITLTNSGTIAGGDAGGTPYDYGSRGGAGIDNYGTITTLTNSGMIHGGASFEGTGTPGDAIYSNSNYGSIGPITNSGEIIGVIDIRNQNSVSIYGGFYGGATFGVWEGDPIAGGEIDIENGNLVFASGKTEVNENIMVDGGVGTVISDAALKFAGTETIYGDVKNTGTALVSAGKLSIEGAVTGAGTDTIAGGAKLEFYDGVYGQDIVFGGRGARLLLPDPQGFYGKISHFGPSDRVYLEGAWAFSALAHSHGVTELSLQDGATKQVFDFVGDYTKSDFHIATGSVTIITHT